MIKLNVQMTFLYGLCSLLVTPVRVGLQLKTIENFLHDWLLPVQTTSSRDTHCVHPRCEYEDPASLIADASGLTLCDWQGSNPCSCYVSFFFFSFFLSFFFVCVCVVFSSSFWEGDGCKFIRDSSESWNQTLFGSVKTCRSWFKK